GAPVRVAIGNCGWRKDHAGRAPVSDRKQPALFVLEQVGQFGHHQDLGGALAEVLGAVLQLGKSCLASVQAVVDLRVEVPAEDTAARYCQHREKRNVAVGGAEAEAAVEQYANGN